MESTERFASLGPTLPLMRCLQHSSGGLTISVTSVAALEAWNHLGVGSII